MVRSTSEAPIQRLARVWAGIALAAIITTPRVCPGQAIYADSLQNGWQSWGWASSINYANTNPVHSGHDSISVTLGNAWDALYIARNDGVNPSPANALGFWIHGGPVGGQQLNLSGLVGGTSVGTSNLPPLGTNVWQYLSVPLSALGLAGTTNMTGFWLQDRLGHSQPTFYLDDIGFAQAPSVTLLSPTNYTIVPAPGMIPFSAAVTASGHTITQVQYYANGSNLLGQATSAPYRFTWSNAPAGIYSVSAQLVFDGSSSLPSAAVTVVVAPSAPVLVSVDVQSGRHAISPLIYGVAFANSNQLADLNCPLNRSGGNSETRYNWMTNAHNRAADWYFESIADSPATAGAAGDNHVANSLAAGAQPMLTIPMIGWAPKVGAGRATLYSYSVAKYGAQTASDPYLSDAGNGVGNSGAPITNNNPNDANFSVTSAFQQSWLQHLTNTWGIAASGGVSYYLMDNEVSLWSSTHQDVHPTGPTMQEILNRFFDYAGMVKATDPGALVCAPEEWGWSGYFFSGYDQQWSGQHGDYNPADYPDRKANAGWDYCPWLLDQVGLRAAGTGQRLLDFFTLHCYPQAGEFGNDVSPAMQLLRNRSTRQLWDTNYVDQSWIGSQPANNILMLLPRMRAWVAHYYPGTRIGLTEYNWGAETSINGATAQADVLGIFGSQGVDLATRWTVPADGSPVYQAMKLYRNYDGRRSTFGETSVLATTPNPDNLSAFAAARSADGAVTLMLVNKQLTNAAALTALVHNFLPAGPVHGWQLTGANVIAALPDAVISGATLTNWLPPQSLTLLVLPSGPPPALRVSQAPGSVNLELRGVVGQRYLLQASPDLVNWTPLATNTLGANVLAYPPVAPSAARTFYRATWLGF